MDKVSAMYEKYFLNGIRRSILTSQNYSRFEEIVMKGYPFIDQKDFPGLNDQFIFFQTEELKRKLCQEYLVNHDDVEFGSDKYHCIIGGLLEYPPNSIEFFSSGKYKDYPDRQVTLRYYGMTCVTSMEYIKEDIEYLWNLLPYPDDDTLSLQVKEYYIEIEYRDNEHVRNIQERALKELEKAS